MFVDTRAVTATPAAAFFDLDGTLLSVNSARLWIRSEFREQRLSRWQVLQGAFYLVAYHFGLVTMDSALGEALATVRGVSEETIRQRTRRWFDDEVVRFVAPGGKAAVDEHRRLGHRVVLLTSSSPYESEIACERIGLDGYLSTRYEVEDGLFTGRFVGPICYGAGKVQVASGFAMVHGLDLDASYFYSDSITDLPMLERVGFPRVVNPDPRLRREARRRRWPVLDWSGGGCSLKDGRRRPSP